jgi:mRNA deadenylase 3'-5' endonuclease subunit Ccr4
MLDVMILLTLVLVFIYFTYLKPSQVLLPNKLSNTNKFINIDSPNSEAMETVSIVTYNILCQKCMKRKRKDLTLEYRMGIIIEELRSLNSDILCLQEVNSHTYKKYFLTAFPDYHFVYLRENYGSNFINLIGYRRSKYQMIKQNFLDLTDINVEGNRGVYQVILKSLESGRLLSVYNVHFPWRPKYELEKCLIMGKICESVLSSGVGPTLIVGDFNSIPNSIVLRMIYYNKFIDEIRLYQRIGDINIYSKVNSLTEQFDNKLVLIKESNRNKKEKWLFEDFMKKLMLDTDGLGVSFNQVFVNFSKMFWEYRFRSAYDGAYIDNNSSGFYTNHPSYTNFTENFKATLDYIFHSKFLVPVRILKLPVLSELTLEEYLPSSRYPSDHLKLYAEFYFKEIVN